MRVAIIGQRDFGSDVTHALRALVFTEILWWRSRV